MSSIDSYWKYENRPAVLVNYGDDSVGGFYLQEGSVDWEKGTEWDVVQWFKDGGKLSQSDFQNCQIINYLSSTSSISLRVVSNLTDLTEHNI